ncbi:ferredoxin [bacterium BMS3Bbin03]|nr:ferredoxin [bacterium BMS3Bbin03]
MLEVDATKCTGCGDCAEACPFNAIVFIGTKAKIEQSLCRLCNKCISACPEGAIGIVQEPVEAQSGFESQKENSGFNRAAEHSFRENPAFAGRQKNIPINPRPNSSFGQGQGMRRGGGGGSGGFGQGLGMGRGGGGRGRRFGW